MGSEPTAVVRIVTCYVRALSIVPAWLVGTSTERVRGRHSAPLNALRQLAPLPRVGFNHVFANTTSLKGFVMQERKQFVVTCKDCHRAVPSGAKEFPFHSIEVACLLCGEKHRYLPSEVFLGRPNHLVAKQAKA
jgi:hypothetical protein